jgi:hypothetical protein
VDFGADRSDRSIQPSKLPTKEKNAAAAASRRLDDALRTYIAERSSKPIPLPEVTTLVTGVANLRQMGDAVLGLWERDDHQPISARLSTGDELSYEVTVLRRWYERLGASLVGGGTVPDATSRSETADRRFIEALRSDLSRANGQVSATAAQLIWTRNYLEAARKIQRSLVEPARVLAANPLTPRTNPSLMKTESEVTRSRVDD